MQAVVRNHLGRKYTALMRFWTEGGTMPPASLEAHCDAVYALYLLGSLNEISDQAVDGFVSLLVSFDLPGWELHRSAAPISVHNCAYAFGALNILSDRPKQLYDRVLENRTPLLGQLVDPNSNLPVFPAKWAHHSWRVSHWIGGVPSILLSLARSGAEQALPFAELINTVRDAADVLLDKNSGLIRAYNSDIAQFLFRKAYSFRHDPELADVGGVAHLLWIDHVLGRRYVAADRLLKQARALFHKHQPFMETSPYCLDFDIVQVVRTAAEQVGQRDVEDASRAEQMMQDIEQFFAQEPPEAYTLHMVPGALATYHECALIAGREMTLGTETKDIIERAFWL